MRKLLLVLLLLLLVATQVQAKTIKIAVIDTGYNGPLKHLCSTGHFDFTTQKNRVGEDLIGHGTKIVAAIEANAKNSDYCLLIYKVFGTNPATPAIVLAIDYALKEKADVLNLSFEGPLPYQYEAKVISKALSRNVKVFVAAGNKNKNLNVNCNVFPACYPLKGLEVIGSLPIAGVSKGNYGAIVKHKENFCFDSICGTSISTAIATGKFVNNKGKMP